MATIVPYEKTIIDVAQLNWHDLCQFFSSTLLKLISPWLLQDAREHGTGICKHASL
ncbi:hypothetical protein BAE44_0006760 [Dichanthelium oligosanthes]|uniref:Uncharacterized protein n=1 Tax=Dichanthelium oligosanthes TaxID=888268 RepID=A0A1E5W4P8_9POAL|nr:hypothetical protein BAE44_0006760 [Dichanthelium oligosanthes]